MGGLPNVGEQSNRTVAALMSRLKQNLRRGDIVAVVYSSPSGLHPGWGEREDARWMESIGFNLAAYEARLRDLQALVALKEATLAVFGDWASLDHPGPMCYGSKALNCSISKEFLRQHRTRYYGLLRSVSAL